MTGRERVLTAIAHREPDRVPLDLGSTLATGIHADAYRMLRKHLGYEDRAPEISYLTSQLARVDEEMLTRLSIDVRGILLDPLFKAGPGSDASGNLLEDEWGIKWFMPAEKGLYYDMISHPLQDSTSEDLARYAWIDPEDPSRFDGVQRQLDAFPRGENAVICGTTIGNGFLQTGNWLEGFEDYMCDLAAHSPKADVIVANILDIKMRFWDALLDRFGNSLDIILELDDLGSQAGLFISPDTYRRYIKPNQVALFRHIKRKAPHIKILFHSCGSIRPIIHDLVETGIDILNPVQISAADMDPAVLKRDFGTAITFWGGGIDTQRTLATGSVQDVRDEVKRMIGILAPGGGYVFTPVHNIQANVPPEKVAAVFEAALEFGAY
jgi:uroporphyrinogen decarboxylase